MDGLGDGSSTSRPGSSRPHSRGYIPPEVAAGRILFDALEREKEELRTRFNLIDKYTDTVKNDGTAGAPWDSMSYADLKKQNNELTQLLNDVKSHTRKERRDAIVEEQELQSIINRLREKYDFYKVTDAPTIKPLVEMQGLSEGIKEALEEFMKETDEMTHNAEEEVARDFESTLTHLARKIADEKSRSPNDDVFIWQRHLRRVENEMRYYREEIERENKIIAENRELIEQTEMDIEEMEQHKHYLDDKYTKLLYKKQLKDQQKLSETDQEGKGRDGDPSSRLYGELRKRNSTTVTQFTANLAHLEKCISTNRRDLDMTRKGGVDTQAKKGHVDNSATANETQTNKKDSTSPKSGSKQQAERDENSLPEAYAGETDELKILDWKIAAAKENVVKVEREIESIKHVMDVLREQILSIDGYRKKNIDVLTATLRDIRTLINTVGGKSAVDKGFIDRTIENTIQGGLGMKARLYLLNYLFEGEELRRLLIEFGYELE